MSWTDYQRWIDRGRPFRLMTPAQDLKTKLRAHGYTVYDIGNEDHMVHEPPEDHTPYSETAYPGPSVYGVGYAVDIMPPAAGARSKLDGLPLPSLQQLGARLLADRKAGVAGIRWLKYMNWEPERNNGGACYQDSWRPTYARRSSSDRGHIHMSGLTGYETSTIGAGYDPVTRIRGGDDMSATAEKQIAELHAIVTAWRGGVPQTPDGKGVEPVGWRIRDEAWQAKVIGLLAAISGQIGGLDTEQVLARVEALATEERERDVELVELVRAGQSGELTAEQVLTKLRDLLPAADTPQS